MVWLNPVAWFAVALVAAPVLVHLLVHRQAEPLAFPTLRFIRPTRLAAMRRHVLEDVALLLVRVAILVAAIAALAAPLVVTPFRQAAWSGRTVRVLVADVASVAANAITEREERTRIVEQETRSAFRATTIEVTSLGDGIRRAVSWLEDAPPARREIVCVSPLPIGSIDAGDFAGVPRDIGLRLVRTAPFPDSRRIATRHIMTHATHEDEGGSIGIRIPIVTLQGADTVLHEQIEDAIANVPFEIVASPEAKPAADAAMAAVFAERAPEPAANRAARLVLIDRPTPDPKPGPPDPPYLVDAAVQSPWIADAIAGMSRNVDLSRAGAGQAAWLSAPFQQRPWHPLARATDGQAVVVAAEASGRLVVVSAAPSSDFVTPLLIRAMFLAMAPPPTYQTAEIVPIADRDLRAWERTAQPPTAERLRNADENDRRWLWAAALALLAVETWMRRSRPTSDSDVAIPTDAGDRGEPTLDVI